MFFFQQLSQFWYNETTKRILSNLCSHLAQKKHKTTETQHVNVALVSCPSIYKPVKNALQHLNTTVRLFEYDKRFATFGEDFVYYNYKDVANYKDTLFKNYGKYFDIVFADPPFLSKECIRYVALFINGIRKDDADIIMCSGATMQLHIKDTLNLEKCKFQPEHERNLANEFCSFANFDLDSDLLSQKC